MSEKGQVTIPKKLRERLGIRPGEVLVIADFSSAHMRDPRRIAWLRAIGAFTGALSRAYASSNRPRAEVRAVTA